MEEIAKAARLEALRPKAQQRAEAYVEMQRQRQEEKWSALRSRQLTQAERRRAVQIACLETEMHQRNEALQAAARCVAEQQSDPELGVAVDTNMVSMLFGLSRGRKPVVRISRAMHGAPPIRVGG